jgi:P27 family predicted phage terminase small subunit
MGRRGPAPKPTNLRVLHGETRPSRVSPLEPKPRRGSPVKPEWLTTGGSEEWDLIVPELLAMGTATAADRMALAGYCEASARFRVATELVGRSGLFLRDRDGVIRKNPAVAQQRDASLELLRWAREFGLTPAARQPLRVEHTVADALADRLLS